MKGFIEVHDLESGNEFLVGIGNISYAEHHEDAGIKGCKLGCLVGLRGIWVPVRETYEEVKALIKEAQEGLDPKDYIAKSKLQDWMNYRMGSMCIPEYLVQFFVDLRDFLKKEED